MSIYGAWDLGCSDDEWEEIQAEQAQKILQCRSEGHLLGPLRAGLGKYLFRVCKRCGEVVESKFEDLGGEGANASGQNWKNRDDASDV